MLLFLQLNKSRFLWMDVPLKSPDGPQLPFVESRAVEGGSGHAWALANKDVALLICRMLDQRSLGRLAQCSQLLRAAAERARRELLQRSVFSIERQVDPSIGMAQVFGAHHSDSLLRLSATYGPVVVEEDKPLRFIENIVLEMRVGDRQGMAWCALPEKHQLPVWRPTFMD